MSKTEQELLDQISGELQNGEKILVFGNGTLFRWSYRPVVNNELLPLDPVLRLLILVVLSLGFGVFFSQVLPWLTSLPWRQILKWLVLAFVLGCLLFPFVIVVVALRAQREPKPKKHVAFQKTRTETVNAKLHEVSDGYFAVTNKRLLRITETGIVPISMREEIRIIHRKNDVLTMTLDDTELTLRLRQNKRASS